jgi:hypothetical protein
MTAVASIVEGDGEVAALPVLLRRLSGWKTPESHVDVLPPIRVYRDRFLNREDEFSRHLQLAAAKCGETGWILVLLDADNDCPAELGRQILQRARDVVPHRRVAAVLANREYEAWFIASAAALNGFRGFACSGKDAEADAELPRNAKGWMGQRMAGNTYRETTDQPAFSQRLDLDLTYRRSRSFRKLVDDWTRNTPP